MNLENRIRDVLRLHPGVRDAVVLRQGDALKALVVPEPAYMEEVLGSGGAVSASLAKWRKVFDLTQFTKEAASAPVGFNTLGWNSSYTRRPIPADQMLEWVESTLGDILPLEPRTVLEVGCGTGLLLMRIAPHCDRYIALDFSPAVLASLRRQLLDVPAFAERVQVMERRADNLEGLDPNSVDTVVINSVVQYFPSVSYLTELLQKVFDLVRDGGHVFVGDVLSLPLEPLLALSVELFHSANEVSVEELRKRIERRIDTGQELILSPAYFLSLQRHYPRVSSVEILPRRDLADNEMSRYRYHAILHIGPEAGPSSKVEFLDWTEGESSLESIRPLLQHSRGECFGIKHIPNGRLEYDLAVMARLRTADAKVTVAQLRRHADQALRRGIHPRKLIDLGTTLGLKVLLSWAACYPDGSYDAVFVPTHLLGHSPLSVSWPAPVASGFVRFSNAPRQSTFRAELVRRLLTHCKQELPGDMVPVEIILADSLVNTASGDVDLEALLAASSNRL